MNRVIKFRAYSPKEGMIYLQPSGLQFFDFEGNYSLGFTVDGYSEFWAHEQYEWPTKSAKAFPIMQFTGLHDKNGEEIYEGDWCSAMFRDKNGIQVIQGKIIIDDFMWCIDCTGSVGNDIFSINRPHDFEIIGNIYEHPELIP